MTRTRDSREQLNSLPIFQARPASSYDERADGSIRSLNIDEGTHVPSVAR